MTTLFYRQWRFLALAILLVVATGAAALLTIGRQEDPTITNLFATVVTPFPGADPARVEALVTEKIEEELREIPEIDTISSTSRTGISVVQVELSAFVGDQEIEQVWSEIRDALADAAVRFPRGVPEPEFDNDRTGAFTAISALRAAPGVDVPAGIMSRYAELLQDRLRQLPATKVVRTFGSRDEEILVKIDHHRLASLGLTAEDVGNAIETADTKVQAGQLRSTEGDLLVEVEGEIESLERVRIVPLRSAADGTTVRVGDVADVRRSVQQPATSLAFADGVPAVLIATRMEDDLQVDSYMAAVREVLAGFERDLPGGLEHELPFDQSAYTTDRLTDLGQNLLIGVTLVVVVLLLTLGWRAALVVALLLPLTSLVSIAALNALGVPIHQMSVTGLIVALGLLVDAAIVMTDEIRQRLARKPRLEAVGSAVRRLALPLLASTVTTVLAFMPMALLPGPAGDFVGAIATAVIVMLTASFVLAMTVTPALAGHLLPDPARGNGGAWWHTGVRSGVLGRAFMASLDLALHHRRLAVLGALILPIMGFLAFPTLTAQFFPGVERDQFYVQLKLEDGSAIDATRATALAAGEIIAADPEVRRVHWVIGESAPAFYYNMKMDQDGVPSFAEALVTTSSEAATPDVMPRLQAALDRAFPAAQIIVRDLVQGPPVDAPVEVRIFGPDLETLHRLGEEARARLAEVPAITHARATLLGGQPKLVFDLDEDEVKQAGLDLGGVARQLETALEGAVGGSLLEGTEELPVRVRVGDGRRGDPAGIRSLVVVAPGSDLANEGLYPAVPLTAVGDLVLRPSESAIARRDGDRVNTVQGFIGPGVLPEEALADFRARLEADPLTLPPGYRIAWGGDSDARAETVTNLMSSVGVIITLAVATIVLTFNSFRLVLVAGIVSVLVMGLSLLVLAVFQHPFGIQALIGVIGSIGVSINAAIIIMTGLQADSRALDGDLEAIRDVVLGTSRHIVSTTITTFGGLLPLILAGGAFWPPFAMAIAGGVLLSTVVSFYFTPPMFSLVMGGRKRAREQIDPHPNLFAIGTAA